MTKACCSSLSQDALHWSAACFLFHRGAWRVDFLPPAQPPNHHLSLILPKRIAGSKTSWRLATTVLAGGRMGRWMGGLDWLRGHDRRSNIAKKAPAILSLQNKPYCLWSQHTIYNMDSINPYKLIWFGKPHACSRLHEKQNLDIII